LSPTLASWELLEDNLNRECSFTEGKEVFFLILKKLLDDNKVVLFAPYSMFNENTSQWDKTITIRKYGDTIWGLPSKEIIQYMRDVFPKDIETENDGKLIDFWFSEECPQIGWVDRLKLILKMGLAFGYFNGFW
jgi:hypothetical protein